MASVGKYTLLQGLDTIAVQDPERLYCIQPISNDISHGWKSVSFTDLQHAVNRTVAWIQKNDLLSNENQNRPQVLAYGGANDVRYAAFLFACMRLGHSALLLSPRNSNAASLHVLNATKCRKFVFTSERYRQMENLKTADSSLQAWEMPSLWEVFDHTDTVPYPTEENKVPDAEDKVVVYIHSSGTTGLPKPLPLTNGYFAAIEQAGMLPVPENRMGSMLTTAEVGKLLFTMSPFFHFMGLLKLVNPIYFDTPFVLSPDKPLTAELLSQIIRETDPRTAAFPPSLLAELSASEVGIQCLQHFDMIAYGGAPLAAEVGDRVTELTHLQSVIGSSECGILGSLKHQDKRDWGYLEWNPAHNLEMRSISDGLYELVILRGDSRKAHSVFHIFPEKTEYYTGDVFTSHPEKKCLWCYQGRTDDIIVLSNGEKFNPTSMEAIIASHPLIARAVIVGQGRFQSAALIEPDWSRWNGEPNTLINEIWPLVKKANDSALRHARLMRDRIGVTSREKPFRLTPKGTIQRQVILTEYAGEIDRLYADKHQGDIAQIAKDASLAQVEKYVANTISDILGATEVDRHADIFAMGLDSLQTLRLGQILQGALRTAQPDLSPGVFGSQQLYSQPSVAKLGQYILKFLQGHESIVTAKVVESKDARAGRLANLVSKYTSGLSESYTVILTGSTGSLGSYLLSELLHDRSITHIYCLNRSADAASRQLKSLQEKGLTASGELPRRVEFLQASFGEERLGLEKTKYEHLLRQADTVIHNAWKVNFNHSVEAFEKPHIEGVRRLVDFSNSSQKRAHIHFISSISTIGGYGSEKSHSIPEAIFDSPAVALRQGYGESKHVSERICATASAKCGVPTSIHRVGQIGGPTTEQGMWNKQEWVPSLIATSNALGKIPTSLGSVSVVKWLPVDVTAKVVTQIVRARRTTQYEEPSAAFHLVNPRGTEWHSLIPAVAKYCDVKEVSLQDWIQTLESFAYPTAQDLEDKPALKILDFFRAIAMAGKAGPWAETKKTQAASETLKNVNAIDVPLVENWMKQWNF